MEAKDYYKILGVGENASIQEIKSTYRKLAKQYHPDANPGNKEAEEKFKVISEAYNVLSDPQKKAKYDQMRKYGFGSQGFNPRDFDFGSFHRSGRSRGPGGFTFEGFDVFGDLGGIFSQFFGGAGPFQQAKAHPVRGQDIHVEVRVPLEKAVRGGKVTFSVQKEDTCPACEGGGAKPGSTVKTCPQCGGRGVLSGGSSLFGVSQQMCPRCYGKGQVIDNPCNRCQGKGLAKISKTYTVNIPQNCGDGEQIRLKGQGEKDNGGLPPGHLYVTLHIKPHRFFSQKGRHIHCSVQITHDQAREGTTVDVKTIHGNKVRLKIPAGIQDGTTLRIPRMGAGASNNRGDQMVTIQIRGNQKKAV